MKLRSDFRTAVATKNGLHRESGEERPEQILLINAKGGILPLYQAIHGGSGMNTGNAQKLKTVNYLGAHGMSSIKEQGDLFMRS